MKKKYLPLSFENLHILASFLIFLNLKTAQETMKKSGKDLKPILRVEIWETYDLIKLAPFSEMMEAFMEFKTHVEPLIEIMKTTLVSLVNYLKLAEARSIHIEAKEVIHHT